MPFALLLAAVWPSDAHAQDYSFPTSAEDYGAFYPTAYRDDGGSTDWNCGGITYSGHGGSDFGGGSWDGMDAGRDIVAAADGTVIYTNDGEDDRCSTGDCEGGGGYGNYVQLQHADGKYTYYGHMKTWSVAVASGSYVACGTKLGEMGSSGKSTGPHVHFEVRTSTGSGDPFDGPCSEPPTWWVDQGSYGGLPGLVCENAGPCTLVDRLRCGATIGSANNAGGATTSHASYGCGEYSYSGPEIAWQFATDVSETVTITLSGLGADLDLFVLGSEACDGSNAVGCSVNPDANNETVTFSATAGQTYAVVVDGYDGAVSAIALSASCTGYFPGERPVVDTGTAPVDTSADTSIVDSEEVPGERPSEDLPTIQDVPGDQVSLDATAGGCTAVPAKGAGTGGLFLGLWLIYRGWRRVRGQGTGKDATG